MNKEEYIDNILLENNRLYNENQQLHNKIDKAIEYINSQSPDAGVSGKTIKEILKDGDVDE